MVKNPRAKGKRTERKAVKYYENRGYLVDRVEKTGKFVVEKDLFSLFDLVCVKNNRTVFVQVKTNRPPRRKDYLVFASEYAGPNLCVESYTWYDRDGPRIQRYLSEGEIEETDLRKSKKKEEGNDKD